MVQVDKRSHFVLFQQNQINHDPYTSELQKAYKTDYLVNRHNMMGTKFQLQFQIQLWEFQLQLQLRQVSWISTPTPTPEVSTPIPTPTPELELNPTPTLELTPTLYHTCLHKAILHPFLHSMWTIIFVSVDCCRRDAYPLLMPWVSISPSILYYSCFNMWLLLLPKGAITQSVSFHSC